MLYCASCQVLCRDEDRCPSCGSRKLREVRENDPVLLLTAGGEDCEKIIAAFDGEGISHEERMCGPGSPPTLLYGKAPYASYHIFVPYGALSRCRQILQGIGILNEFGEKENKSLSAGEPEQNMSPMKRTLVRIVSALAFILLIWAAVKFADTVVSEFQNLFH